MNTKERPKAYSVAIRVAALVGVCSVLLMKNCAFGQTAGTGALSGAVLDPSGAAVAGAKILVTSQATGESRTVISDSHGVYLVSTLLPESYCVEVSKDGFKTLTVPGVKITVTETRVLNLQLEVGLLAERIIVEASAEQLQTQSSTLGSVTSGDQVRDLPLVTRNYTQIVSLNPGVAADVNDAGAIGRGNLGNGGVPVVSNGGTESDNNVQMNGAGINDLQSSGYFSGGVAIPNPDTIQEFKVQTSQYDAAYGRNAGANVDVITKGGSNDFHGALWEFFRNEDLNANTYFRNAAAQPRPVLKQNQFGFDLGGPIRRDKLFFFVSYQGTRQRNGLDVNCSSSVTSPPITNDRSAAALGQIFAGQRGDIQTALGGVGPAIASDGSNINPVALALLQMKLPNGQYVIPTPQTVNPSAPSFDAQGFSAFSVACPYSEDQFMTNADWQISTKSKLEGRFFFSNSNTTYTLPQANLGGGTAPGFPVALTNNFRNFTLTHTYIFSSSLINRAEIGYQRTFGFYDQDRVFSYSQIGATVPSFDNEIPAIGLDTGSATGMSLGGNGQTVRLAQNNYSFQDSLSWIRGRHALRFGGGVSREQLNEVGFQYLAGELFLSWPDFLLGLDAAGNGTAPFAPFGLNTSNLIASIDIPALFDRAWRVWEPYAYVQDDIKVTSRRTVNLGLRYDRLGDFADSLGRNSSFDVKLANPNPPASGSYDGYLVSSNYPGGALPPGVKKVGNEFGGYGENQNTWNPRVGFAWRLPKSEQFVLRGGYGIYHSRYTGQPFLQLLTSPPFGQVREPQLALNAAATEQVPFSLNVPSLPAFPAYGPAPNPVLQTNIFDPRFRPPMVQAFSLGLQTQLPWNLLFEASYSGARGQHLIRERSLNQADLASPADPIRGQTTNTVANVPLRVPFEGWDPALMNQIESAGASWYNALLVGLNKRFSNGRGLEQHVQNIDLEIAAAHDARPASRAATTSGTEYDVVLKNGHIIDGAGNPWVSGDLAIRGDRIAAIGRLDRSHAKRVIDAKGFVISPGFIDMLGQSEAALLIDNRSLSKLSQGITTEITGEGGSIAPQSDLTLKALQPELEHYSLKVDWTTLDAYFKRLEKNGTPLNIGTYVGAGQVREAVLGDVDRAPTPEELERMKDLVAQAMGDGAFGLSTALIYPPGHYATTQELIELAKVASQFGGIYATHMRSEGQTEPEAVAEALRIGREANLPVEIFHLKIIGKTRWGNMPKIVGQIQAARDAGQDVSADMYPYTAGGTALASSLPPWVADGGLEKLLDRLHDPGTRDKITREMAGDHPNWENLFFDSGGGAGVMVAGVNDPDLKKFDGMTIAQIAEAQNKSQLDALFDFVIADKGQTGALYFIADEQDLAYGLKQPWTSIGLDANESSLDGPLYEPHTHPRAFGTMPRFLGHYVRDERLLSLEQGIRKITSLPAQRERLPGRGLLKEGFYADITVFDESTIQDEATYKNPTQLSKGVKYVFVNGQLEFEDGTLTGSKAGRVLRGSGSKRNETTHQ